MTIKETVLVPAEPIRIADGLGTTLTNVDMLRLWERMVMIRLHEELVETLNAEGLIRGSTHLYIGMEAGAVGVVSALSSTDLVIGYYRSHGHALALGVPATAILAEILGRVGGCCGGRGGTKHLMDVSRNYLGAYAIVGQQVALATGLALALRRSVELGQRPPSVIACFFGDGAVNQGTSLEGLNLASVFNLPCLFICENNQYAVSAPAREMVGGGSVVARAQGFGIEAAEVNGMDVLEVRRAAGIARQQILDTGRPYLIELKTYRYRGHSVFQVEDRYRDPDEVQVWKDRDPIKLLEGALLRAGESMDSLEQRRTEIRAALAEAAEWAKAQPVLSSVTEANMYADTVTGLEHWGVAE